MTTFPGSPRLIKGGIVLINADTSVVEKIITLQYNPDTLTRTLQIQGAAEGGNRSEALRLMGPPVESLKVEAEMDATDQLEAADSMTLQLGLQPRLAALETIVYPKSGHLVSNNSLSKAGTLEIVPMETALTLFIWSKNRIVPVRITEFSITEEAFDVHLNPIRAKISLGMRVLSINDLDFEDKGGGLYMSYLQNKETLASMFSSGTFNDLGINSI